MKRTILFAIIGTILAQSASAGNGELHEFISSTSLTAVIAASALIGLLILIASLKQNTFKAPIFISICLLAILTTFYVAGATIYLNATSESQGPVHWHTDFEVWKCGERLNLKDPTGLSNRIGTPVFHEHNDQRVHIEGVVTRLQNIDLKTFFSVVGGSFSSTGFTLPTNDGLAKVTNGDLCGSSPGELQVFLYRVSNPDATKKSGFTYTQTKLENPQNYIPAPYAYVPPGDCVIIEFDIPKDKTDKICESYRIAREQHRMTEVTNGS